MKPTATKIVALFLIFFFGAQAVANPLPNIQAKIPSECQAADNCLCLVPTAVDLINNEMKDYEKCLYRELAHKKPLGQLEHGLADDPWWADPTIVISGVAVSFSVGALVGVLYEASKK